MTQSRTIKNSSLNRKWLIVGGLVAVLVLFLWFTYNSLVGREEKMKASWSTLQATYQRRSDLLPSLNEVVQAAANFEQSTLVKLTEIRSKVGQVKLSEEPNAYVYRQQEQLQGEVANTMNQVLAVIEKYPELKSQKSFLRFQDQIKGTENRIKVARKDFNEVVASYNTKVRSFPSNLAAGIFGFKKKDGFESEAGAEQAPEVRFKN
jgi:LemA protein